MEIFYKDQFGRLAFRSTAFIRDIDKHIMDSEFKENLVVCSIVLAIWLIIITT